MSTLVSLASARLRRILQRGRGLALMALAAVGRSAFVCRALAGRSQYNLTINADLSVSCNCNDARGRGRIGDVGRDGLAQVLRGERAAAFRRVLARGRLPIPECGSCHDLERIDRADAAASLDRIETPSCVRLETMGGCNLRCIGCERHRRPLGRLSMPVADLAWVGADLAELGVRKIALYSLGEPFLSKQVRAQFQAVRDAHPTAFRYTSTNGALLDSDDKRAAALQLDSITFSIDGCDQDSLVRYQAGGDFAASVANLTELVRYRRRMGGTTEIIWKYVLFNWNDRPAQLQRAVGLAAGSGADKIVFVHTLTPLHGLSWRFFTSRFWRGKGTRRGRWHWIDPHDPARSCLPRESEAS